MTSNRLPRAGGRDVLAALLRGGFEEGYVRGSHHYLRRPEGSSLVVVPVHGSRSLPLGTLRSILRQAELTADEFTELLRA